MSSGSNAAGPFCRRLYIHESHIERICREALASVELLPESPGPVRIERFIYLTFGFEEEFETLPANIMGCAKFTRNGLCRIIVNRDLAEQDDPVSRLRVRSTLAHEAGHGLFHNQLFIEKLERDAMTRLLGGDDGVFDSVTAEGFMCRAEAGMTEVPKFEWWEYQANLAMAALLLPKHLVVEAARARMPQVLSGPGTFETRVAAAERELAGLFNVSRKMVSIRLGKWWSEQANQPSLF
jgi:hypothetical protein